MAHLFCEWLRVGYAVVSQNAQPPTGGHLGRSYYERRSPSGIEPLTRVRLGGDFSALPQGVRCLPDTDADRAIDPIQERIGDRLSPVARATNFDLMETELPRCAEMGASCLEGVDAFLGLESEWRDLARRARTGNPFLSWEWVSEWARMFWDDQLVTVVVDLDSTPVAIAPFCPGPSVPAPGVRSKNLQLLGPRWGWNLSEMGSVLIDPAHASEALAATVEHLWQRARWDWIEVMAFGDDIDAWQQALRRVTVNVDTSVESVSEIPVMRLDKSWEALRSRLRRNVKESIRRSYNAPRRDGVEYSYREHRTVVGLDAALDDFFRLHRARSEASGGPSHADHFFRPSAQLFLRRVSRRMAEAGLLSISVCKARGASVAVQINFEVDGWLYLYYSGFDPRWARYSVMTYTRTRSLRSAIDRHLESVNFSPGVDQAKKRWDVTMIPMQRFSIVLDRRQSRARFALYSLLRKASVRLRAVRLRNIHRDQPPAAELSL
jgi:CelD/BcsL family acetyltransferase involved in cellulose biosynthesis